MRWGWLPLKMFFNWSVYYLFIPSYVKHYPILDFSLNYLPFKMKSPRRRVFSSGYRTGSGSCRLWYLHPGEGRAIQRGDHPKNIFLFRLPIHISGCIKAGAPGLLSLYNVQSVSGIVYLLFCPVPARREGDPGFARTTGKDEQGATIFLVRRTMVSRIAAARATRAAARPCRWGMMYYFQGRFRIA